jgi:cysteine synthase A
MREPVLLVVGGGWPFRARASFFREVSARGLAVAVADLWHAEGLTAADLPIPCRTLDIEEVAGEVERRLGGRTLRGIGCLQDVGLVAAAQLAARHELPSVSVAAAKAARNKRRQRELFAAAGLTVPRWRTVSTAGEIADAIADFGPVVVKPAAGTASFGVRLVSSGTEAEAGFVAASAAGSVLAEEFLEGPEFSVETISGHGEHRVAACTRKLSGPLPYFVEMGHTTEVDEPTRELLARAAPTALDAIGFDHGVSHTEFRLTATGPVVIEVNGRVAGDLIPMLHQLTGAADLHAAAVAMALGDPLPVLAEPVGSAAIRYLSAAQVRTARARLAAGLPPSVWMMSLPKDPADDSALTWSGQRPGYVVTYLPDGPGAAAAAADLVRV